MIQSLKEKVDKDSQEAAVLYLENLKLVFEGGQQSAAQLMSLSTVKSELGVSDAVLRELMLDPSFPRIKVGRKLLIPRISLVKYLSNRSENWYKF